MALISINKTPSRTELRWFGLMFAVFFGIFGIIVWKIWGRPDIAKWVWIVSSGLAILYYAAPPLRLPLYLGWLYAAFPIGWTISHLLMGIVYYLIMTPIGLIMRLVGYDPMNKSFDPDATTYWEDHKPAKDKRSYFRQF